MGTYLTSVGVASVGFGLFLMIAPKEEPTPLLRLIAVLTVSVLLIEPFSKTFRRTDFLTDFFSTPAVQNRYISEEETNKMVMNEALDKLSEAIRERAGEESEVQIETIENETALRVTVYGATHIVGLRAYIEELLEPKEVLIYGKE